MKSNIFISQLKSIIKKVIRFNGRSRKGFITDIMIQKCFEGAKYTGIIQNYIKFKKH